MNFDGIEIDMLFAKLTLKEIPDTMVSFLRVDTTFFLALEFISKKNVSFSISRI